MEENKKNAIKVQDLHLSYKSIELYSIKQNFIQLFKRRKTTSYDALRGITFDIKQGEIVGIIGRNGSGKSTLLRTLAGILSPNKGSIDLYENSISLLSIGVGFQGNLTGRNNIVISGLLLGFSEKEVLDKMEDIIEFSELADFIDKPVKTYSSGMYSKLGFSINAILETDILLVDEVLSVGDEQFRKKSFKKMKELINDKKRTVIIVSHNLGQIQELCTSVIWLHDGCIKEYGETKKVISSYKEYFR